jgi:hypothetical protein
MYIFLKQTVKVIHFPKIIRIISIGQRINQGNFHINLLPWRSGENLCPRVNIHDHMTSRVILDCVHMSKQTWPWIVCFIYSRLSNFSAIRQLSPLPVTGLQI